jgi:hypothetical protein
LETVLKTHEVANVQEAVELASRFKDEGRYNWFRGQVQDWPPYSSYFRIRAKGDAAAITRAERRIDFDKFRSLFAREVIPAQAVEGRKPTLFNPVELITFGIP